MILLRQIKMKEYQDAPALIHTYEALSSGQESLYLSRQQLNELTKDGIWAFADTQTNTVYFWVDENRVNLQRIAFVLGHEVGHLVKPASGQNSFEREELRADSYGQVTEFVLDYLIKKGYLTHGNMG